MKLSLFIVFLISFLSCYEVKKAPQEAFSDKKLPKEHNILLPHEYQAAAWWCIVSNYDFEFMAAFPNDSTGIMRKFSFRNECFILEKTVFSYSSKPFGYKIMFYFRPAFSKKYIWYSANYFQIFTFINGKFFSRTLHIGQSAIPFHNVSDTLHYAFFREFSVKDTCANVVYESKDTCINIMRWQEDFYKNIKISYSNSNFLWSQTPIVCGCQH